MKTWMTVIPVAASLLFAGQAVAQSEEERLRADETREAELEVRLREAEEKMAEAARTIAELTKDRLPQIIEIERHMADINGKPRLGIAIGAGDGDGPVEGVSVMGVTPGSAADEAGLRAGDIITSINDESLSAESAEAAASRLLDFMEGVEEDDKLDVEYLRNGNVGRVEVTPRAIESHHWEFAGPGFAPPMPEMVERFKRSYSFGWGGSSWGDMELVELSEGLGRYFGTSEGLLVVTAPESNALKLEDGDVIQSIDGRTPKSVGHAMRILGSYQSGETLELTIMRDKKRRTLEIEMPDDRMGMYFDLPAPPPAPHGPETT